MLSLVAATAGALATGILSACSSQQPQPATKAKGAPTLMPTALPTAAPVSGIRVTPAPPAPISSGAPSASTGSGAARAKPATTATTRATATATAASPSTPLTAQGAKRDVVIMQGADVTQLDPHLSTFATDVNVTFAIFDNLTSRTEDQSLVRPQLATEWAVEDRRWVLKLRPNVRFHNGDPLTSEDVKFSIERTYDPAAQTGVANVFSTVQRIETPDPLTVVFIMRQPDPLLPSRLAFYGGQIMPKAYFNRVGAAAFQQRPIGTGPYKFAEWQRDNQLILERFDDYWGGQPNFARVIFKPRPETAPRIAALLAGDADLVTSVPADQAEVINRSGRARVDGALYNGLHVLVVNALVPPLDNPLIKQALSLAIDRDAIIRAVHKGQGVIPNGLIAQGDFGFDATLPPLEYNPDRAKHRLTTSGYQNDVIVLETTQGYLEGDRQMAEIVHEMWQKIGVNSRLELIEISERAEKTRQKSFRGIYWSDPVSTLLDPDGMMYRLLGPGGSQEYWSDPEWVRLGDEARSSLDQGVRLQNYRRMNEMALEHLPWIPVVQPRRLSGISNLIEFRPYGNGYVNVRRENLKPR